MGPYWDDGNYRKLTYQLCVMGRLQVYGGKWNLPEAKAVADPFQQFLTTDEMYTSRDDLRQSPPATEQPVFPDFENITPSSRQIRKDFMKMGLQEQLPADHPLLKLHRKSLELSHEKMSPAVNNYMANVSRILYYVATWLRDRNTKAWHWTDLLCCEVDPYIEYLEKRERLGQTIATSINYIKNLSTLFDYAFNNYAIEDPSLPKTFDLQPCTITLNKMRTVCKEKDEATTLPQYAEVKKVIDRIESDVPEFLGRLEDNFASQDIIRVAAEPRCSGMQRMVSTWWRKTSCGVAVLVLWISKHRSGVVSDMTTGEWSERRYEDNKAIVTVAKHKTGDKEPALIVLPHDLEQLMMMGKRLVKLYDKVNKIYGSKLSACIFRRMAKALQHSEGTALRYYQVPDTREAIRRQATIETVDQTANFEAAILEEFYDFKDLRRVD
ncbi:Uncharacterized protein FWK35_00026398 [Aphis craccivora]|uniref:Uncharacterized protein n=1 Tax=Aphis craccivora TaxID=307492 RepID=A0A6G0VZL2_APHCR|nr:Uncharacterized protein FWK35_00026398 [Aphis craccivora]